VEHLPNVIRVILHVKLLGNDFGDPGTSPEIVVVSGLPWSNQENLDELAFLLHV
jgi:hypothetical protein